MGLIPFLSPIRLSNRMDVCVASIIQNLDPPAELTNDLLTVAEPKSGKTLIEIAVILGNVKYIEKLLKMKPDLLNYSGHSGHSISELSVLWNRSESVEALFKAGANFTVPNDDGKCPQVLANEIGYTELANYIDKLAKQAAENKAKGKKGKKIVRLAMEAAAQKKAKRGAKGKRRYPTPSLSTNL